jgi:Allene oxide cyclase barrel like domain
MRKTIALGMLAAAALLIGGSAGGSAFAEVAGGSAGVAGVDRSGPLLRFDVNTSPFNLIDVDRNGQLSDGDEIVFHDTLLQRGRRVGDQLGSCVIVDETEALANCTMVIRLPQGRITAAFDNAPPPNKILAITGGTGRYRTAHGEATLVENPDQTAVLTLRILP